MGWAKLPFYSLGGERGALYLRYGRKDVSGLPCSASVFATLGFLEAAATSPLQALPEASEQEHAVSRGADLCRSFAEWKAAQGGRRPAAGAGGQQQALQAALEHGGFGLRVSSPARGGSIMLAVPVDIALPRGLLASLDAADPRSGRAHDFFDWLAGLGEDTTTSGRLRLFLMTHRSATFAVLADGRDRTKPMLHLFDPLGSTLHTSNMQPYAVTFVATRRSGLEFNERLPAEQADDFFRRRFYHTLKVDDAVTAAMAAALEDTPAAGAAALKAAVRRHAIIEVQEVLPGAPKARMAGDPAASQLTAQLALLSSPKLSVEAIYESLVAPQGGSAPATPRNGSRLSRFGSSPPAALPPRPRSLAASPARATSSPQPWDRAANPRAQSPGGAAGLPHLQQGGRGGAVASPTSSTSPAAAKPKGILRKPSAFAEGGGQDTAAAAAMPNITSNRAGSLPCSPPLSPPRAARSRAGSVAGDFCLPSRHAGRRSSIGSVAGDYHSPARTHSRRSSAGSDAMLFKDSGKKQWLPRAPTVSPTSPYSPRMARRRSGIAADLQQAASALEADLEAESRAARRHRRAASVSCSTATTELPDSFMCKRDPAKLKAAIAKAVGAPAIVTPHQVSGGRDGATSTQLDATPAAAAVASGASNDAAGGADAINSFARTSNSSDAAGSVRRTSAGAASDASSALPSSQSDGSGATSNDKTSASMSTDSAYGRDLPDSLRGKGKPIATAPSGKGARLSSIPEPAPQLEGKAGGALMAGIRSMFRWGATA